MQEIPLWPREIPGENDIEAQKFSWLTKLWKKRAANQIPSITYYEPKRENVSNGQTPAILVCPGGGYGHLAPHEGEPIALWLNKLGYRAFVLRYRIYPYHNPYPLIDALRAVKLVRFRASEWSVNPKKIGMLGFSAGGHLTATVGTHYDFYHPALSPERDEVNQKSAKPNALILCYAVISLIKYAHKGVIQNLLGKTPSKEDLECFSAENAVDENTPPTFLWHTEEDQSVPVEHAHLFAESLKNYNVEKEINVFKTGKHGLGLAQGVLGTEQWTKKCADWLKKIGF